MPDYKQVFREWKGELVSVCGTLKCNILKFNLDEKFRFTAIVKQQISRGKFVASTLLAWLHEYMDVVHREKQEDGK